MNTTIFNTPVIKHIMLVISKIILFCIGWKAKGKLPDVPKCVMIAAPHTSNWDFFYTLLIAFQLKIKIYAMGKNSMLILMGNIQKNSQRCNRLKLMDKRFYNHYKIFSI